jgi:hypothetical protein
MQGSLTKVLRAERRIWDAVERYVELKPMLEDAPRTELGVPRELDRGYLEYLACLWEITGLLRSSTVDLEASYNVANDELNKLIAALRQSRQDRTLGMTGLLLSTAMLAFLLWMRRREQTGHARATTSEEACINE